MGIQPSVRILRDMAKRQSFASNEVLRRAYKYISRNTTLPPRVRHQAQLALNSFPNNARAEMVKERCTETGRGKGVFAKIGLCRYQFRLKALNGELTGIRKASW